MEIDKAFDTSEGKGGIHLYGNDGSVTVNISSDGRLSAASMSKSQGSSMAQYIIDNDVIVGVLAERERQNKKWGEQTHPDGTGPDKGILHLIDVNLDLRTGSELAEIFKRKTDRKALNGTVTWKDILLEEVFEALAEDDLEKLRTELVQVAAVAVQWAEAIDRREADNGY